jgi:glycerophosphoryl diester phosphodiesterase
MVCCTPKCCAGWLPGDWPLIGFAHRGAPRGGVRENSLAAFGYALKQGAAALESDVWLTADRVPVLVHDGAQWIRFRRRAIAGVSAAELPRWLPSLEALYEAVGSDFELSLDMKDPAAARPVAEAAARHEAAGRLWLCGSAADVSRWRAVTGAAHLVVSTTLRTRGQSEPAPHRIGEAADVGAAAVNLRAPEWSAALVQRCHDRELLAFAWDVQERNTLAAMQAYGCDAVYSDHLALLEEV